MLKQHASKYAIKRRSGAMMYGPVKPIPKPSDFKPDWVSPRYYWWGEPRPQQALQHQEETQC